MAYDIVFVDDKLPAVPGNRTKERAVGEAIFLASLPMSPKVFAFFYPGETDTEEVEKRLRALGKKTGDNLLVNFSTLVDPDYKRAVERFSVKALPVIIVTAVSPLAAIPNGETTFVRLDGKSLFARPDQLVRTVEELFNLFLGGKIAEAVMVAKIQRGKAAAARAADAVWAVIKPVIGWAAGRDWRVEFTPVRIEVKKSGGK
jgi:hypothetical protein